jgi:hypothetical protein
MTGTVKRFGLLTLAVALVTGLGGAGLALIISKMSVNAIQPATLTPTLMTIEPTDTLSPTFTATPSATDTLTPTTTSTPTSSPTATVTLSTLVVQVTAVNPDVTLSVPTATPVTSTQISMPTLDVPVPGATVGYSATGNTTPVVGWQRYMLDTLDVTRSGQWDWYTSAYRPPNRRYLYSDVKGASLTVHFLGAALRVRYARFSSYGSFSVRLDGASVATIDAYLPKVMTHGDFATTGVFALTYGWHTLEIERLDQHNSASSDGFVAIASLDIYQDGPLPTVIPTATALAATLTPSPAAVQKIQLLVAPPTVQSTTTPAPVQLTAVSLTVAYDENGNKAVDPTEGVQNLPVELITADTNRVVASGVTDAQGYIRLEAAGTAPLRLVVPYFNRFWNIAPRTSGTQITLLIPPANRPALIP